MTSALFTPIELRGLTLPNRIVVAPMCQYASRDGLADDFHIMHWGQFATGGVGLFIAEATGVEPRGRITPQCLGLWSDETEAAIRRVVDFCKRQGRAAPIGIQLAHAGRKASARVPWDARGRGGVGPEEGGWQTVGPSPIMHDQPGRMTPEVLDRAGMDRVRDAFVQATVRSDRCGFDMIEMHAAHGYLLSSFLSPLANHRTDEYGGSVEKRMRFPLEVFAAMRKAWPADKPLGVRLSATDWEGEEGLQLEHGVAFAGALKELGCDYVVPSSGGNSARTGTSFSSAMIPIKPGYQVGFAEEIRKRTGIMTMAVGMIVEPRQAENIVLQGKADMVALGRHMMYQPHWAWLAAEELGVDAETYADRYLTARPASRPQAFPARMTG